MERIYMIGINVNNLDTLINRNNVYLSSVIDNEKKLVSTIFELNNCYKGSSLEYLFSVPISEIKNIKTITSVVNNYCDILKITKVSYQKQDSRFTTQVNHHVNSNLM